MRKAVAAGPAVPANQQRIGRYLIPHGQLSLNASRLNFHNFTGKFMVATAARYENYSDFGSTLNGKLAARLAVTDHIALRGSVSTGFRAPVANPTSESTTRAVTKPMEAHRPRVRFTPTLPR